MQLVSELDMPILNMDYTIAIGNLYNYVCSIIETSYPQIIFGHITLSFKPKSNEGGIWTITQYRYNDKNRIKLSRFDKLRLIDIIFNVEKTNIKFIFECDYIIEVNCNTELIINLSTISGYNSYYNPTLHKSLLNSGFSTVDLLVKVYQFYVMTVAKNNEYTIYYLDDSYYAVTKQKNNKWIPGWYLCDQIDELINCLNILDSDEN